MFDARGLSRARLLHLAREKDAGGLLADLGGTRANAESALNLMASHAVSRPVVVDVTSEETGDLLLTAARSGFHLVLANKKPLASSWDAYSRLFEAAQASGRHVRFEATVGAGLPIIDTFHKLEETGDRVRRIDGSVSGTLMFVLSEVSAGRPSRPPCARPWRGDTRSPIPREDLSGQDAARKGLILARMMGYRGPPSSPDDLVPAKMKPLPFDRFMERLDELDEEWRARTAAEAARGHVWRYVVSATPKSVSATAGRGSRQQPDGIRRRHPQHHQLQLGSLQR